MFFITGMTIITTLDSTLEEAVNQDYRCFGYFKTFEEAQKAVENNHCDIFETMYMYVVIEEIDSGIHATTKNMWWYKYNLDSDTYSSIENPNTGFINYALG